MRLLRYILSWLRRKTRRSGALLEGASLPIAVVRQRGRTCWAASVACIVNFYKGTSLDALSVLNMATKNRIVGEGIEAWGTIDQTQRVLELYGVRSRKKRGCFSNEELRRQVDLGRLIWFRGYMRDKPEASGHAAVAYGYLGDGLMYYMEPNFGVRMAGFSGKRSLSFTDGSRDYVLNAYLVCLPPKASRRV